MLDKKFTEYLTEILRNIERFMIIQNRINSDLDDQVESLREEVEELKFYISNSKEDVENSN